MKAIRTFFSKKGFSSKIIYSTLKYEEPGTLENKSKFILDSNFETAKKQVYWRIRNIGQRELEMLIGEWFEENSSKLSLAELNEFSQEVLSMENPELNKYFVKLEDVGEELKFTKLILTSVKGLNKNI